MPRYGVVFTTTASALVKVEADSPEEAREKAPAELDTGLCHHCARRIELGDFEYDEDDADAVIEL
ncbi:hypothetical protein [Parafrankia sp. EUN1f]|uniref:hypothetical protein n=1 Tax=Parafrankia sp. EUN1f TaxID=102897 RepID=UPI0001C46CF7|nr:hypothetical protein [Parafrankia sp. EUN1f]EFC80166.1 hypothetical protein FrEUN1fDRAFT_6695 [Parafrankia sp. EUN1f]